MDAKKRQEVRAELVSHGYSWDYVDSWPPKVTLYVHRPLLNDAGQVSVGRGTALPNHPGHPDHLARKSRIGLLSWPPGDSCMCRACRELREIHTLRASEGIRTAEVNQEHAKAGPGLCACGWVSHAATSGSRAASLAVHLAAKKAVPIGV